jgi:RNA polymerase sigma-70 factor (ECF subfamily)
VIRGFFRARWRGRAIASDTDDAVQEVFVDCLRPGGALERVRAEEGGGFRPYLRGVARKVALRIEERARRRTRTGPRHDLDHLEDDGASIADEFDRAWARSIMGEAASRMRALAQERGDGALARVELLTLRFEENLPIRTIAERWQRDPAELHREYAKARREFRAALLDVVSFHLPASKRKVEEECEQLVRLFQEL